MLLLVTLAFELSNNYWLNALAKTARTGAIIGYIMRNSQEFRDSGANNTAFYCCFGLLWTLVIGVIIATVYLIVDRERDHVNIDNLTNTSGINTTS